MSLEAVIRRKIERIDQTIDGWANNPTKEQQIYELSQDRYMLEGLLDEAKEPTMETELRVHLTLSVDAKDDVDTLKSRIKALLESSSQMYVMEIDTEEEAKIYGHDE